MMEADLDRRVGWGKIPSFSETHVCSCLVSQLSLWKWGFVVNQGVDGVAFARMESFIS
jgi:hypothetical protein